MLVYTMVKIKLNFPQVLCFSTNLLIDNSIDVHNTVRSRPSLFLTSSYLHLQSSLVSLRLQPSSYLTFRLFGWFCFCVATRLCLARAAASGHGFEAVHWIMIKSTGPPLTGGHMAKDSVFLSSSVHRLLLAPLRGWGPMRPSPSMNVYELCLVQAYADNPSCC